MIRRDTPPGAQTTLLTPGEQRIAALVATGASNRSIAARLDVSLRTVESHLHHIYCKTGIGSRVELALSTLRAA